MSALDGMKIVAGDLRFLAWTMTVANSVLAAKALTVVAINAGIGRLWGCPCTPGCWRSWPPALPLRRIPRAGQRPTAEVPAPPAPPCGLRALDALSDG